MQKIEAPHWFRGLIVFIGPSLLILLVSLLPGWKQGFLSVEISGMHIKAQPTRPLLFGSFESQVYVPGVPKVALGLDLKDTEAQPVSCDPKAIIAIERVRSLGSSSRDWAASIQNRVPLSLTSVISWSDQPKARCSGSALLQSISEANGTPASKFREFPVVYPLGRHIGGRASASLLFRLSGRYFIILRDEWLTIDGKRWQLPKDFTLPRRLAFFKTPEGYDQGATRRIFLNQSRSYSIARSRSHSVYSIRLGSKLITRTSLRKLREYHGDTGTILVTAARSVPNGKAWFSGDIRTLPFSSEFLGAIATIELDHGKPRSVRTSLNRGQVFLTEGEDARFVTYEYDAWTALAVVSYLLVLFSILYLGLPRVPGLKTLYPHLHRVPNPIWLLGGLSGFLSFRLLFGLKSFLQYPYELADLQTAIAAIVLLPAFFTSLTLTILTAKHRHGPFRPFFPLVWLFLLNGALALFAAGGMLPMTVATLGLRISLVAVPLTLWTVVNFVQEEQIVTLPGPVQIVASNFRLINSRRVFYIALATPVLLFLIRLYSSAMHHPERFDIFGLMMRWSVVSLLLILPAFTVLVSAMYLSQDHSWRRAVSLGALLLLAFPAVAYFAHDLGWLLYGVGIFFCVMWIIRRQGSLIFLTIILLLLAIVSGFVVYIRIHDPSTLNSSLLRVAQILRPDFSQIGIRNTENLLAQLAQLSPYVAGLKHVFGFGYLQAPYDPGLPSWARSDGVPAIYLFSEFGIFGLFAVGTLITFMLISVLGIHRGSVRLSNYINFAETKGALTRRLLGLVAVLTLVGADLYMLTANLNWVPFTGKNVIGLGVVSFSDLVEFQILLTMVLWAAVETLSPERQ